MTEVTTSTTLSEHAKMLRCWVERLHDAAFAEGLTDSELRGVMADFVALLPPSPQHVLTAAQQGVVEHHVGIRLRQGCQLNEILMEFAALGQCATIQLAGPALAAALEAIALTTGAVALIFDEHMLEDEQTQKRYSRRLRALALGYRPRRAATTPPLERVEAMLALVVQAMDAVSGSLLLLDPTSKALIMTASVGVAREQLGAFVTTGLQTLAGRIASHTERATSVADVASSELRVSEALRESGIHGLVGVALVANGKLRGVIYVGTQDQREFTASELRRLESLGETLALQLDRLGCDAGLEAQHDTLSQLTEQLEELTVALAAARARVDELEGTLLHLRANAAPL